jgi:hypothetical protein
VHGRDIWIRTPAVSAVKEMAVSNAWRRQGVDLAESCIAGGTMKGTTCSFDSNPMR